MLIFGVVGCLRKLHRILLSSVVLSSDVKVTWFDASTFVWILSSFFHEGLNGEYFEEHVLLFFWLVTGKRFNFSLGWWALTDVLIFCSFLWSNFLARHLILYAFMKLWNLCFGQLFFTHQPFLQMLILKKCNFFHQFCCFLFYYFFFTPMPNDDLLLWVLLELLEPSNYFDFEF